MKAQTSLGKLYIQFNHVWPNVGGKLNESPQFQNYPDAGTYCLIKDENHEIVGQGRSTIHPNDMYNFCRETGRKIALRDAIRKMYIPKEDRTEIWEAYLNRNAVATTSVNSRIESILHKVRTNPNYEISNARGDIIATIGE